LAAGIIVITSLAAGAALVKLLPGAQAQAPKQQQPAPKQQQPQEPPAAPYFTSWLRPQILDAIQRADMDAGLFRRLNVRVQKMSAVG